MPSCGMYVDIDYKQRLVGYRRGGHSELDLVNGRHFSNRTSYPPCGTRQMPTLALACAWDKSC